MKITDNTDKINSLISAINSISVGGGSGTGSVTFQKKTGTFQSSGNSTTKLTIDCGFTPDIVLITPPDIYSENGYVFQNTMGADFTKLDVNGEATVISCVGNIETTLNWIGGYLIKIQNGFKAYNFYEEYYNGDFRYIEKTFTYTAIKYT